MEEVTVIKRDGREVPFDDRKIFSALKKCFQQTAKEKGYTPLYPDENIEALTENVVGRLQHVNNLSVEEIQDIVEQTLIHCNYPDEAKHYILYRAEKNQLRVNKPVPYHVYQAFKESERYFATPLQQFQFFDKYSRFNESLGRRETWQETVNRAVNFLRELSNDALTEEVYQSIYDAIVTMRVMPSMRLLATAGPAARRNHLSLYNCSYVPIDSFDAFVEALYISMSGCGVGFSVERRYIDKLPRIKEFDLDSPYKATYLIEDTSEGWSHALRYGLGCWQEGIRVDFDYSQIRPAGSVLKTKGGRASGPDQLRHMLNYFEQKFIETSQRSGFIRPLDAHDLMCNVGQCAVSGGFRRTSMLSLFDIDDKDMLYCKSGDFEREHSYRWNANNSAVWERRLNQESVAQFMLAMVEAKRGEPGIFNRSAANRLKPARRSESEFGTNP